jgi:hypothetical protein
MVAEGLKKCRERRLCDKKSISHFLLLGLIPALKIAIFNIKYILKILSLNFVKTMLIK